MILWLCLAATGGVECRSVVRQQAVQVAHVAHIAHAPAVVQPIAVTYPTFVYAAGESLRLAKLEEIAAQNAALQQQQAELIQALRAGAVPPAPAHSATQTAAARIVATSCLKCHHGATAKGGLDLAELGKLTTAQKLLVVDKVETGEMPPAPAQPVGDADFQALRKWALEDRAAVRALLKAPPSK